MTCFFAYESSEHAYYAGYSVTPNACKNFMIKASVLPFYTYHNPYQKGYSQFCHEIQKNRIETELFNCARSSTSMTFYL